MYMYRTTYRCLNSLLIQHLECSVHYFQTIAKRCQAFHESLSYTFQSESIVRSERGHRDTTRTVHPKLRVSTTISISLSSLSKRAFQLGMGENNGRKRKKERKKRTCPTSCEKSNNSFDKELAHRYDLSPNP